jgi:hypothetical protein
MAARSAALRETRSQSTPKADGEQATRTRRNRIIAEIKELRDTYGQKGAREARPIPFYTMELFFERVMSWAREERETDASDRIEAAVREIEKTAEKMEKRLKETGITSYAQALSRGIAGETHGGQRGWSQAPIANPQEEKRILVRIPDKDQMKEINEQSREEIIKRIRDNAGASQEDRQVIAVRKLKSGDLAVHVNNSKTKRDMEETQEWAKRIAPAAEVRKRTWPILIHAVRVADYGQNPCEENAKRIQKENERLHPGLKIASIRWLGHAEKKEFTSMIIEIESASQANRVLQEGIVMKYDLKSAEIYDHKSRITQCFKCQRYGHISTACNNLRKCGHCGGQHHTDECAEKTQAKNRQCAACDGGDHQSWSPACPARQREMFRAKQAKRIRPRLYAVSAVHTFAFNKDQGATHATSTQSIRDTPEPEEWTLVGERKRRLNHSGRPRGAVSKAKTFTLGPEDRSILSFTQSTVNSTGDASEPQAENLNLDFPADSQMSLTDRDE